jgi:hypothetical protein
MSKLCFFLCLLLFVIDLLPLFLNRRKNETSFEDNLGAVTLTAALSFGLSVPTQDSGISTGVGSYDNGNSESSDSADFNSDESQDLFPGGPGAPGPHPGPPPHRQYTCFAQNRWGQQFRGVDYDSRRDQDAAMYS